MKRFHTLLSIVALLFCLSSCTTTSYYYQLTTVTPTTNMDTSGSHLTYEDASCRIQYNFWSEGGNTGFEFFNKTDSMIYLDKGESFLVVNNVANDYFKSRHYSSSTTATASNSTLYPYIYSSKATTTSNTNNIGYDEQRIVCIPPHSSKFFYEYNLFDAAYRSCSLSENPQKKSPSTLTFTQNESPFTFGNRITYSIGHGATNYLENNFYVSSISNYYEKDVIENIKIIECGVETDQHQKVFTHTEPYMFYNTAPIHNNIYTNPNDFKGNLILGGGVIAIVIIAAVLLTL